MAKTMTEAEMIKTLADKLTETQRHALDMIVSLKDKTGYTRRGDLLAAKIKINTIDALQRAGLVVRRGVQVTYSARGGYSEGWMYVRLSRLGIDVRNEAHAQIFC